MLTRNRPEGERFWASERRLHYNDLHFLDYYELELVLDGVAEQSVNTVTTPLSVGTLTLLSPRDFHSIEAPHGETISYFTIGVCPEELSTEVRDTLDALGLPLVLQLGGARCERLISMMRSLAAELSFAGAYRIPMVRRRIELILFMVARYAADTPSVCAEQRQLPEGVREIYSAKQYIDTHFCEPISRSALAASVHYSQSYFSTRFAEVMGMSLSDYLTEVRLAHAVKLLSEEKMSVKDAISSAGFRSPSLFYRAFCERYGCSPSVYFANKD